MSTTIERQIVARARALQSDKRHRCREHLAKARNGVECDPRSQEAVQWCAIGALMRAAYEITGDYDDASRQAWALGDEIGLAAGVANEDGGAYGLLLLADTKGMKPVLAAFEAYLER